MRDKIHSVPVIMYHSIGPDNPEWLWNYLITPVKIFEEQVKLLSDKGFNAITLQELYDYMKFCKAIPDNPIVLTFDDGYLDNWVYTYPILKKYRMKGTIFVNPEFVDPTKDYRPNLEDVWKNRCMESELDTKGFLSWHEMRMMEESGTIDIQSHSMSHTWFFCGNEIIDFHYPGNKKYPWLFWNALPERKSYYLRENQEHFVSYGIPIYQHGRSLGIRRYFEDGDLNNYLVDFVKQRNDSFFNRKDWRNELFARVEIYRSKNSLKDRYETDKELEERYKYELIESKRILEEKLNKRIQFLCWAGGALNDKALEIAKEAGYLATTLFYNDTNRKNIFGEDPSAINRTGCISEFYWKNKFISYTDPCHFMANIKNFSGKRMYLWVLRLYKFKYLLRYFFVKGLK